MIKLALKFIIDLLKLVLAALTNVKVFIALAVVIAAGIWAWLKYQAPIVAFIAKIKSYLPWSK